MFCGTSLKSLLFLKSDCLQETIEDIDKDKDGMIDIEEYIGKWVEQYMYCDNNNSRRIQSQMTITWRFRHGEIQQ